MSITTAAQAIFEFITGDKLETHLLSEDAASAARYALNCQDSDIYCGHEEVECAAELQYLRPVLGQDGGDG